MFGPHGYGRCKECGKELTGNWDTSYQYCSKECYDTFMSTWTEEKDKELEIFQKRLRGGFNPPPKEKTSILSRLFKK